MKWLGLLAIGCYAIHAGYQVYRGQPENILWACHVAAVAVGVGLLGGWAVCVAVGVLWLVLGIPLCLVDFFSGGEFIPTTLLTHVGGAVLGVIGLRHLGMPEQVWWKAFLALLILQQVCRWVTPASANVNLAFAVYPGWERWFPSYRLYWLTLALLTVAVFWAAEYGLRRWVAS